MGESAMPSRTRGEVSEEEYRKKLEKQKHDRHHRELEERIEQLEEKVKWIEMHLRR